MKYKYENFKDWKELYLWAGEGKPIKFREWEASYPSDDGSYDVCFDSDLSFYQKAIPIREEEYCFEVKFYKSINGVILPVMARGFIDNSWEFIKKERIS